MFIKEKPLLQSIKYDYKLVEQSKTTVNGAIKMNKKNTENYIPVIRTVETSLLWSMI